MGAHLGLAIFSKAGNESCRPGKFLEERMSRLQLEQTGTSRGVACKNLKTGSTSRPATEHSTRGVDAGRHTQTATPKASLHELPGLGLLGGNVEPNPGPRETSSVLPVCTV